MGNSVHNGHGGFGEVEAKIMLTQTPLSNSIKGW
jgi:hypothetical protein